MKQTKVQKSKWLLIAVWVLFGVVCALHMAWFFILVFDFDIVNTVTLKSFFGMKSYAGMELVVLSGIWLIPIALGAGYYSWIIRKVKSIVPKKKFLLTKRLVLITIILAEAHFTVFVLCFNDVVTQSVAILFWIALTIICVISAKFADFGDRDKVRRGMKQFWQEHQIFVAVSLVILGIVAFFVGVEICMSAVGR